MASLGTAHPIQELIEVGEEFPDFPLPQCDPLDGPIQTGSRGRRRGDKVPRAHLAALRLITSSYLVGGLDFLCEISEPYAAIERQIETR